MSFCMTTIFARRKQKKNQTAYKSNAATLINHDFCFFLGNSFDIFFGDGAKSQYNSKNKHFFSFD